MQLAYVICAARGETDRLLSVLAERLAGRGMRLAGVAQTNTECADDARCDMDLRVLPDGALIRISQSLGTGARGCRLDASALEEAVALVGASLDTGPDLLIVNKFGKHEADGRGFRPLIAEALLRAIPVLVGVNELNADRFRDFAGGEAVRLEPEIEVLGAWAEALRQDVAEAG